MRIKTLRFNDKIYTFNIFGALGASNPISSIDSTKIFELNPEARKELAAREEYAGKKTELEDETKKYVAFVNRDRKRFFQQWYFGFRIKSYANPKLDTRKFPATFEVSYGFNDFIVPGFDKDGNVSKRRGVLRIGGYIPFKFDKFNFYVFGTAFIQLSKEEVTDTTDPIIMNPKLSTDVTFPGNSEVVQLPFYNEPRDFFKIGIGINLKETVAKMIFKKKDSAKK